MANRPSQFVIKSGVAFPEREKRGPKPQDDDKYIELALAGKAQGSYTDHKQAARALSKLDTVSVGACYRRLLRKLKPHF